MLSAFGANIPILRFLYTLTYANGGMFGGFFGAVGGIFGKAVFATVVNTIILSLVAKKNPFANATKSLKGIFGKAAFSGLSAVSPFLVGAGVGLVLYWFFNITSSPVNCGVAVVGAVGAFSAIGKKNGIITSLVYTVAGKLTKGRFPSQVIVNRTITGFSAGFALGLPLTFVRFGWLLFLVGAIILGPRIGKYGKNGKVNAIPGHSITLGALGVFILWFAWYGFNGAAAEDGARLGQILLTTTIAPAVATVTTMLFTWIKNGKPDVSMCLNASLAGLVAITAGCADVDAIGAAVIGIVSGILIVVAVEFVDIKLKIDDPVGAFSVHGVNGMWGGLAVGLFATGNGQNGVTGLFYGGGFAQLGKQALGIVTIVAWTVVCMIIVFTIIKKTVGLRVTKDEEMKGLDICEHGLISAYADFMPIGVGTASLDETFDVDSNVPVTQAVPVQLAGKYDMATDGTKITKIDILLKQSKLEALKEEMDKLGITGMTVSQVLGCGAQKGKAEYYRGVAIESNLLPKMKVEIVVCKVPVKAVVDAAVKALYTGHIGDGKIFIYDVEDVVKVRTGETGYDAMQDVE